MSNDGLIPKVFSELHPKFRTPWKSNLVLLLFVCIFGGFIPGRIAGNLTSFGTLFAFAIVCIGILVLRAKNPDAPRPFSTPWVPVIPALGALVCILMMVSLGKPTIIGAIIWMIVGLVIYFVYGTKHSKLQAKK